VIIAKFKIFDTCDEELTICTKEHALTKIAMGFHAHIRKEQWSMS
jgi:hypothetical protein